MKKIQCESALLIGEINIRMLVLYFIDSKLYIFSDVYVCGIGVDFPLCMFTVPFLFCLENCYWIDAFIYSPWHFLHSKYMNDRNLLKMELMHIRTPGTSTYPCSGIDKGTVSQEAPDHFYLPCPGCHVQGSLPTLSGNKNFWTINKPIALDGKE